MLLGKELKGHLRTFRLLIVAAVFFVFGLGTPLLIKYLPAIMKLSTTQVDFPLPVFTVADVIREYVETMGQVGLFTAVLVGMGSAASEIGTGTAALVLSKPVGRGPFLASKLAALAVVFAIGLLVAAAGCYAYTLLLFGPVSGAGFLTANLLVGLYLLVALSVTIMYSSFFRSPAAAGALSLASLIGLSVSSGLPVIGQYSPGLLLAWARQAALGGDGAAWGALAVAVAEVLVAMATAWWAFRRKEL